MALPLRKNLLLLFLVNLGSVFSYLYQVIVGRYLTPEEYGLFNSLNSLAVLAATPLTVVPLVMAKYAIGLSHKGTEQVRSLLRQGMLVATLCAAGVFAAGALLSPVVSRFLHTGELSPVFMALGIIALSYILPVPQGILQGLHRFDGYALANVSLTFFRFAGAALFVAFLPMGVNGALLAGVAGTMAGILTELLFLRDMAGGSRAPLPKGLARSMLGYSGPVFLSTIFLASLGNLDLILVRHFCAPEDAGLYSTAAIFGRIAFFLPSVLSNVLFPQVVKAEAGGESTEAVLWRSLGLTVALAGSVALAFSLWPDLLLGLILGSSYGAAGPLLRIMSIAMALLAAVQILATYDLAKGRRFSIWVMGAGVALMTGAILVFHESAMTIAEILLAVEAGVFAVILAGMAFGAGRGGLRGQEP